jgi:hypothetical protein
MIDADASFPISKKNIELSKPVFMSSVTAGEMGVAGKADQQAQRLLNFVRQVDYLTAVPTWMIMFLFRHWPKTP